MSLLENEYDELLAYKLDHIARRRELMENMTSGLVTLISEQQSLVESEVLPAATVKRNLLNRIGEIRYGNNQYFLVCDMHMKGLAHPLKTMIGKTWIGYQGLKQKDAFFV